MEATPHVPKPGSEERILAFIAHISALSFGMGVMIPAFLWAEQRKKSSYLAFQTLQAYSYQSLGYTVWMLGYLVFVVLAVVLMLALSAFQLEEGQFFGFWMIFFVFGALGLMAIYSLFPIVAAIQCALGLDFRYPLLGRRLAKYMGYATGQTSPDSLNEERVAAAMGHFTLIFFLWGLFAPLGIWLTQGKHSPFLRLQSIQTVLYQSVGTILYFLLTLVGLGLLFPFYIALFSFGSGFPVEWLNPLAGVLAILGLCLIGLALLLGPLYHLFGQWAGLQVLLGRNFQYPFFGRWAARWANPAAQLSATTHGDLV